ARKFSSLGRSLCPREWRARNATCRPSSVPRMYASEGSPKGVCCWTSCGSLNPGIWYKPLPPIMPISACCNYAPDGLEMTMEMLIIQDGNSWLRRRGLVWRLCQRPEVRLHPLGRLVVQTFGDQYRVAANFYQHDSLFGQPGMASTQRSPGIHRRCVFRNFAIHSEPLPFLIPLRQRFRIHRPELRGLRRTRPAGNIQHSDRRRFVSLRLAGKVIATTPRRIHRSGLIPARILFDQHVHVKLSHRADIEGVVAFEVFLHVD